MYPYTAFVRVFQFTVPTSPGSTGDNLPIQPLIRFLSEDFRYIGCNVTVSGRNYWRFREVFYIHFLSLGSLTLKTKAVISTEKMYNIPKT
jgi:hypothetical protein